MSTLKVQTSGTQFTKYVTICHQIILINFILRWIFDSDLQLQRAKISVKNIVS